MAAFKLLSVISRRRAAPSWFAARRRAARRRGARARAAAAAPIFCHKLMVIPTRSCRLFLIRHSSWSSFSSSFCHSFPHKLMVDGRTVWCRTDWATPPADVRTCCHHVLLPRLLLPALDICSFLPFSYSSSFLRRHFANNLYSSCSPFSSWTSSCMTMPSIV